MFLCPCPSQPEVDITDPEALQSFKEKKAYFQKIGEKNSPASSTALWDDFGSE